MNKKITYLLGAGASANAIPVVAQLFRRINEIIVELEKERDHIGDKEILNKIIDELKSLLRDAEGHYTIDTLARKLYLLQDFQNLKQLKNRLILYFTLEQYLFVPSVPSNDYRFVKSAIDTRYVSFIATIANQKKKPNVHNDFSIELNKSVNVLTWNYDIQFELSLQRVFSQEKTIHHTQNSLQIYPNEFSVFETEEFNFEQNKFSIVKLNGNAIWNEQEIHGPSNVTRTIFDSYTAEKDRTILLSHFLRKYKEHEMFRGTPRQPDDPTHLFNFAWESDPDYKDKYSGHAQNLALAEKIAKETEILVVIGYSFPIFNRSIDKRIFDAMNKLEKVYVQDLNPERIISTMENAFPVFQREQFVNEYGRKVSSTSVVFNNVKKERIVKFSLEKYTDQFVIPYEMQL